MKPDSVLGWGALVEAVTYEIIEEENFSLEDKTLTTKGRKNIKESNFALSGRRYPIHDISHARNALARVSQHGTSEEKKKVRNAVYRKYPSLRKGKKK